ncbi:glycosyltransferase family 69 protein [Metarhizium rileyi]|uniref:Glycosyltransferase family 69 protein n=1 Tax=Metarhizium rileyi (strain RCEF 4871) TaxID=1649241 RepID=A0A167KQ51_METRR|nr:glycosyltransferase family 69 protein [Metarhizium rileyi RCEF 4871]
MRRKLLVLSTPMIALLVVETILFMSRDWFLPSFSRYEDGHEPAEINAPNSVPHGVVLPSENITRYLEAILTTQPSTLPTLECPAVNITRYRTLQSMRPVDPAIKYFFALNLRQNLPLLPQLMGSIIGTIRFLGPSRCVLSIVEGNSPDGTADVLHALRPTLRDIGAAYYLKSSGVDPSEKDRIERLAQLRNEALAPLLDLHGKATSDTTVIFLNDVSACAEDILELVYQRTALGADMTCAMDWTHVFKHPTFYDVWVARTIDGDSFFDIPPDGNWDSAWNLFWNAQETRSRFFKQRPFQVFSCWNGATAFTAQPLLENIVRFRAASETAGECRQGEPQLFCKDLWFNGYRRIAVVPSVNLEYSVEKGKQIKEAKGFTSDIVSKQSPAGDGIEWRLEPPEMVKCMPTWGNQYWQSWNETLKA